ncbi:uncharacterized protein SAPINGB_P000251 [Magnusiomyces paraingens]|uniref:Uncharacterized protein n=1 Tax=Magnusiomyces paraingens TaxID=2606893 RepID=A0A5E8AZ03_9ASCO|nr:uncharacterized protein SAPINGB_P000251 [Saprochaete ingens]VVT43998.1 unnamed protein product [Saprochaete ingens]
MPPPRIPKLSKKKKKAAEPTTASEFLDAGVDDEEHGDRWIDSGDIPKAIRFYQKAAGYYQQAITMSRSNDKTIRDDATYNFARMQYVVYTKVVKTGELDNLDLGRLGVPLDGSGIVPTGISQVLQTQEHALNEVGSNGINGIPLDQLYTYGQVLAEAGEETENVATVQRAAEVFQGILERQLVAISELENEEFDDGEITTVENPQQADKTVALAAQEGVVPTSVVETITSLLDSLNTLLELSRDDSTPFILPQPPVPQCLEAVANTVRQLSQISTKYNGTSDQKTSFLAIPSRVLSDAHIAIAQILSTCSESVECLVAIWTEPPSSPVLVEFLPKVLGPNISRKPLGLPDTVHCALAAADALFGYAERPGISADVRWTAYSRSLTILKTAWERVAAGATGYADADPAEKLQVLMARGDAELLRASLQGLPAAEKHREVLRRNARNMYTSADNLPLVASGVKLTGSSPEILRMKREIHIKTALLDGRTDDPVLQGVGAQRVLAAIREQGGLGLI